MSPIRIGLVGLSTTSTFTNWAANAHLPYLTSPQGQKHYEIVALCNSSVASARKSIEHYKLPPSVKSYGSVDDLIADSDVDLIVNVTNVNQHYDILMPALRAGKNVYTELPLAVEMKQMRELVSVAEEKQVKTVFGMQGQTLSVTKLLRSVIAEGKIGKVLSTVFVGHASYLGEKPMPKTMASMAERKSGATMLTVQFLHAFNYFIATVGDVAKFQTTLGIQRPLLKLIDPENPDTAVDPVKKDVPDHVLLQGHLESGALFSFNLRAGETFKSVPATTWSIYGEDGEIRITCPSPVLDVVHTGVRIELRVFGNDEPEVLELPKDDLSGLKGPCENVGRIYEAYAQGKCGGEGGYPDWKVGLKMHELIDEMTKQFDNGET